jgi:NADH:ubiquinone oxidoreductase subunit 6 (subunit J)
MPLERVKERTLFQSLDKLWHWLVAGRGWLLVLPMLGGFLAIWSLLPQARRWPRWWSISIGTAALVLVAVVFLQPSTSAVHDVLFYLFAGLAVISGVCMLAQHNPVHAALWFALVILSTCGLFLLQAAPFLAAATIIIYAGPIVVTFLFVIMLAQQSGLAAYDRRSREPLLASLAGFILLGALLFALQQTFAARALEPFDRRVQEVKKSLEPLDAILAYLNRVQAMLEDPGVADWDAVARADEAIQYVNTQNQAIHVLLEKEFRLLPQPYRQRALRALEERVGKWSSIMNREEPRDQRAGQLQEVKALQALADEAKQRRLIELGSPLSQPQANDAGHVAGLGRSLFGDYLYAVELAGTLLLVATIGAIAIVSRRNEVTR